MTSELVARFEKRFGPGISIDVDYTQSASGLHVTALFGPSGCGKTTLLRCLAGLTNPDRGIIEFQGKTWFSSERQIQLSPQRRDIGFLFQDYALFPHLSVADNIGFGLQNKSQFQRSKRVTEMIELFDLQGLEKRFPHQISGGQQQRVALARALARRPKLLLLDEPLSALDTGLREQLRGELRRVLVQLETPVIIVTHDRVEAIVLADQVAVEWTAQWTNSANRELSPDVFVQSQECRTGETCNGIETVAAGRNRRNS